MVSAMLILVFSSVLITNLDHGSVPAATIPLQIDLGLSHDELGFFGSLVFVGLICGAAVGACVLDKIPYKLLLSGSMLVNAGSLWVFAMCTDYYLLCSMRFLAGVSQTFMTIFYPVFIDTVCTKSNKSFWMNLMLVAPPLGVFLGYCITAMFIVHADWRASIIFIAMLSCLAGFMIILMPEQYVEMKVIRRAMEAE